MILRVISLVTLIFMAAVSPYFLTIATMIFFTFYFDFYLEAVVVALLIDSLYGRTYLHWSFTMTLIISLALYVSGRVKRRLFI